MEIENWYLKIFMILAVFIFGLIIGSFLNVVIYRLRHGGNIAKDRSRCVSCRRLLSWHELIPVASFLIQKRRCRGCKNPIDWQYPLVELITGMLFVLAYAVHITGSSNFQFSIFNFQLIKDWFFISVLVIIFVYDLRWQLIPDEVTLPAIGIGILFKLTETLLSGGVVVDWLLNLSLAVAVGGGFFLLQFIVSKGRWIGGGDIRLGVLMGVILGWPPVVWAVMLAYVIGAIVAIILVILKQKTWSAHVPFGTFLAVATFIIMYWGQFIFDWYINILN